MATITLPQNNSRTPTASSTSFPTGSNLVYPSDLVSSNRDMYMVLTLNHYTGTSVLSGPILSQYSQIVLPIPIKINEQPTVNWEQASVTSMAASAASSILKGLGEVGQNLSRILGSEASIAANLVSLYTAATFNPFMVMLFKTQNFKEHVLQWAFAPQNTQDRDSLHNIIEYLKAAMLPAKNSTFSVEGIAAVLDYPDIVQCAFNVPTEQPYLYNFKPCAITSLFIDWSGGSLPAFFSDGSPAIVTITMQLKEIELWFRTGEGTYA